MRQDSGSQILAKLSYTPLDQTSPLTCAERETRDGSVLFFSALGAKK